MVPALVDAVGENVDGGWLVCDFSSSDIVFECVLFWAKLYGLVDKEEQRSYLTHIRNAKRSKRRWAAKRTRHEFNDNVVTTLIESVDAEGVLLASNSVRQICYWDTRCSGPIGSAIGEGGALRVPG